MKIVVIILSCFLNGSLHAKCYSVYITFRRSCENAISYTSHSAEVVKTQHKNFANYGINIQ